MQQPQINISTGFSMCFVACVFCIVAPFQTAIICLFVAALLDWGFRLKGNDKFSPNTDNPLEEDPTTPIRKVIYEKDSLYDNNEIDL